ncbi:hypothetical protein ACFX13_016369 [Malus domestica]
MYPVVPGHEITGLITKAGSNVKEFKEGDRVGVGCLAATCLECEFCKSSQENYCDQLQFTYNGIFWDGSITYGGYSKMLVADHRYVVHIPQNLPLDAAAPLLCAGATVFTPMKDHNLHKPTGKKIGVVGLGGLGHVAVKFGKAFGHHVTVISTSPAKEHLGADDFLVSTDPQQLQKGKRTLDFSAPDQPFELPSFPLIFESMIGGITEIKEMMDLCGKHKITCDIELTTPDKINEALDRVAKNDVRYRFVIDIAADPNANAQISPNFRASEC